MVGTSTVSQTGSQLVKQLKEFEAIRKEDVQIKRRKMRTMYRAMLAPVVAKKTKIGANDNDDSTDNDSDEQRDGDYGVDLSDEGPQ
ncbi:hypothetical protein VNO77_42719 [Canavalia gladiata]|uniref:Uncharacterized protein n=1 Tax=Canavalia gladiata TaxID=3824 RepID=A0AAN9JV84_CANGL